MSDHVQHQDDSGDIADMQPISPHWTTSTASDESQPSESQPSDSSEATLRDEQSKPNRPSSHMSRVTNGTSIHTRETNQRLSADEVPYPIILEGWVDNEYRSENPWYGQTRRKPVFSLGKPLPHTSRRAARSERGDIESQEDDSIYQVDLRSLNSRNIREQQTANPDRADGRRRKPAGVSHGGRRNDAGQPVFDYVPFDIGGHKNVDEGGEDTGRVEAESTPNKPSYAIDSEPIGKRECDEVEMGEKDPDELRNWWARVRAKHAEPLAEFLATGVAVFLGLSATLSVNLTANQLIHYGTFEMTCWAWGFAWMLGIYLGGGISGAHMNPVISISLAMFRGFPWRSCAVYIVVQFLAALAAGALAWAIYRDTILYMDPTLDELSKSFFSSPREHVSVGSACLNQVVGSAILVIAILALGDDQNNPPGAGMHAFVLGLLITMLRFSLGYTAGAALNPASDFGPRVIAYAVGYRQPKVFKSMWWFYGPFLANMTGCIIGCSLYDSMIFVGSESPINYRVPEIFRKRTKRLFRGLGRD